MDTPSNNNSSNVILGETASESRTSLHQLSLRRDLIATALAAVISGSGLGLTACGSQFTSSPYEYVDAGGDSSTGGNDGGTGGSGLEGGAGSGGTGGEAGSGGEAGAGGCDGTEITLDDMAAYEYILRENNCYGQVEATSLGNGIFETGATTLCLDSGKTHVLIAQVRDPDQTNTLNIYLPEDSKIPSAFVTTLTITDPMDVPTSQSVCTAQQGIVNCSDSDLADTTHYQCDGLTSASNAYKIVLSL